MKTEDIKQIANLARIALTDEEINRLKDNFADVLSHIKKLDEVDISGVEPVGHPLEITNVFREDELKPSLGADVIIGLAPDHHGAMVKVPQVIENKS